MMRSRRREVPLRWPMLVSALLHVLAVLGLSFLLIPVGGPHLLQQDSSIQIFFPHTDSGDEALKAEVPSETPNSGQKSDGVRTHLVAESEARDAPEGERVFESSTVQVSEAPEPPDPRPPTSIMPQSIPSTSPSRPTVTGRRKDTTPKRAPPIQPQAQPHTQEPSGADQLALLPESTERMRQDSPDKDHHHGGSSGRAPVEAGSGHHWHSGRVPLLSGSDLDKYAKLPVSVQGMGSRPLNGLDRVISLNSKDIRYLSYFAQIKHKIEQVWSYPSEGVARRMQGQLLLLFVLQHSGQVKKVELLRSSGSKVLDKEAWDAIVNAAPFDPFPPRIPQEELHIRARFSYVLDAAQQQTTVQ